MKKRSLKFHAETHPAPEGINAVDSIRVYPRSMGKLSGGQFLKNEPRNLRVHISAVDNHKVEYDEHLLGTPERYTVVYEILNLNDSLAFAYLTKE